MKKVLTICALGALSLSVYAQGLVTIDETSYSISTNATAINGGTSGRISNVANSFYFELLVESDPTGSTTLPTGPSFTGQGAVSGIGSWTDTGVSGTNSTGVAGGHINAILGVPGATASSWAAGSTNFFIVVAWSANLGSSWSAVSSQALNGTWNATGLGAYFGVSTVGYGASQTSPTPGFSAYGTSPGELNAASPTLLAITVPEPATMALAAIGGASLLLFRRKK